MLCDGHFSACQNLLRHQPNRTNSVNLVDAAAQFFMGLCVSGIALHRMEALEVRTAVDALELLTECVQGPCAGNQERLVSYGGFVAAADGFVQAKFHRRVPVTLRLEAKAAGLLLLSSLVEGRADLAVHLRLAHEVEPTELALVKDYASHMLAKARP